MRFTCLHPLTHHPATVTSLKCLLFAVIFFASDRGLSHLLQAGLRRSFGMNVPAEVVCIGHSHTALGIDSEDLTRRLHVPVAKFALNGANAADRLLMIRHYLNERPSGVKLIIYDVDAHTFTGQGLSLNSYALFYPFLDDPAVRDYVRQYAPLPAYYTRRLISLARFNLDACNAAIKGWLGVDGNFKRGTVNLSRLRHDIARRDIRPITFDRECVDCVERTLDFIAERGIRCVLLYIPTIDVFNQAEPQAYDKAVAMLRSYADQYETVAFLDYNRLFAHRHELFYDPIHLNPEGRAAVTARLARDLADLFDRVSYARGGRTP